MKPIIVANLKSYKTQTEYQTWLNKIKPHLSTLPFKPIIAPTFPFFPLFLDLPVYLAAQNVSPFPPGSYTGEVNAQQLKSLHVSYCIVGHSERRTYFHETSSLVLNKIEQLLAVDITPIVCVGKKNYQEQLSLLPPKFFTKLIFAFEPEESIGTHNPADPTLVEEISNTIVSSTGTKVLYGGSVNSSNLNLYTNLPSISGVLVGSYSLSADNFISLLTSLAK